MFQTGYHATGYHATGYYMRSSFVPVDNAGSAFDYERKPLFENSDHQFQLDALIALICEIERNR